MKRIQLGTSGYFTTVDDADFASLNELSWSLLRAKRGLYAKGCIDGKNVLLHRLLMKARIGEVVDHRDNDGLNNRRYNLRLCTHSQNVQYRTKATNGRSRFKGVQPDRKRWRARIIVDKKQVNLGAWDTEIEAASAYNVAALKYFGEFAIINEI